MPPKVIDRIDMLANTAAEAVYNKTKDRRLIILYPRHRQHSTLISLLHKYYADFMYYYCLNEEDNQLPTFILNLSHDAMFPIGFGEQTRQALMTSDSPGEWGKALAEDMALLHKKEQFMVMLDNFDELPRDDDRMRQFFNGLAKNLPNNIQVIVNGRELRRQPWYDLVSDGAAIALGDEETMGSGLFEEPSLRGQLEVYALAGGSRVLIDGRPIIAWEGSLPRNLFYFFVDKPMVTRAEVFEAFWPSMGIKEATNVFHVTKRKISEKLGYDLTDYENGFYVPNDRINRLYDVNIFVEQITQAMKASKESEALDHWHQAVTIYKGQFLKEVNNMEWARQRRVELRDMYAEALINIARIQRQKGKKDEALVYFVRGAAERPDREDVHREVMELYAESGQKDAIAAQYRILEETLTHKLGINPSQETRDLYERLVGG